MAFCYSHMEAPMYANGHICNLLLTIKIPKNISVITYLPMACTWGKCCNMNFERLVWVMTCSPCLLLIPFTRNYIHDLVLSELHCHRVDASKEKNVLALNSLKSCYQYV